MIDRYFRRRSTSFNPAKFNSRNRLVLDHADSINYKLDRLWRLTADEGPLGTFPNYTFANDPAVLLLNGGTFTRSPGLTGQSAAQGNKSGSRLNTTYVPPGSNFSFSFWGSSIDNGVLNRACGNGDFATGTNGVGMIWGFNGSNNVYTLCRVANNGTRDIDVTVPLINIGLHHFAYSCDSVAGAKLYWDGVLVATNAAAVGFTSTFAWTILSDANSLGSAGFNGRVQDMRCWSRTITQEEVQRIFLDKTMTTGLRRVGEALFSPPPPGPARPVDIGISAARGIGGAGISSAPPSPQQAPWHPYSRRRADPNEEPIHRPIRKYTYFLPPPGIIPYKRPTRPVFPDDEVLRYKRRAWVNFLPRVSQLVSEILGVDVVTSRVTQYMSQVLSTDVPSTRVSQYVIEILTPFIEVPMPVIYPTLAVGFSVIKRPKWSTGIGTGASGREVVIGYWAFPLWEWDLTYEYLPDQRANGFTDSDLKTLMGFFLATKGMLFPFLYLDPNDNTVTAQPTGVGDGFTAVFTLFRTYGLGDNSGTEPVGYVNDAALFNVYVNGVLTDPGDYTVVQSTPVNQYVRFNVAPAAAAVITVDMSYYYYVRCAEDKMDFEEFLYRLWTLKKITLVSKRG